MLYSVEDSALQLCVQVRADEGVEYIYVYTRVLMYVLLIYSETCVLLGMYCM